MPQENEEPVAGPAPLPPEAPRTGPSKPPTKVPLPPAIHPDGQPLPADAPPMPSEPPSVKQPLPPLATGEDLGDDGSAGQEWWRTADVREELREAWDTHGHDAMHAAAEIGAQIGAVIAAHLPDPYAAAQQRNLDLRWLRLGLNIPALALALLATWGGQSPADRMTHYAAREGPWAPLGWVLLPALVLAALMALPSGGVLGTVAGGLARGAVALLRRAWAVPYLGFVLRLAAAVAAWSLAVAVAHRAGRAAIHLLTGV